MLKTLPIDARRYCYALAYARPNSWGQVIVDGYPSHAFLRGMTRRYGSAETLAAIDLHFAAMRVLAAGCLK